MSLDTLPPAVLALLGLLIVVQIGLHAIALVTLFRTPPQRLVFGSRWPWLAIILLVNLIGAILFLAIGRTPATAVDPAAPARDRHDGAHSAQAAVDLLYPPSDQGRRR